MDSSLCNLDRFDHEILLALQADARLSSAELSEKVNLTTSPCWRRVKRLESLGVITGYHARVDLKRLGYEVTALVMVALLQKSTEQMKTFESEVCCLPEVVSCYNISGPYDYQLTIVAKTLSLAGEFLRQHVNGCASVKEVFTSFVVNEVKAPVCPPA
ncbi:Lrp/AsnC family transcriptional regulator [Paraburkholderia sp. HD33-4]|uniref:Lrp/AsnC family transcriptional regulator n=1 Tax=Paraburkholderia sp. HD33-4 TaxID=2883242 RepID=UPI001F272BBA|nr:Lrp/AsnC family transcriptional regulator [Paraburkholderia sp. HD33-4]